MVFSLFFFLFCFSFPVTVLVLPSSCVVKCFIVVIYHPFVFLSSHSIGETILKIVYFKRDDSPFFWDCQHKKKTRKKDFLFSLDMMTDTAIQQPTDSNGQTLVTPAERQALIQKL
jgi:hypothetical protein